MPPNSDGSYQDSDHSLKVTVRALPGADGHLLVTLAGEIDLASSSILSKTLDRLFALAPVSVLIDLAAVTFSSSTLANFVVGVRQVLPDGAELTLWRARPATDWVLRVTGMASVATIRDEITEPITVAGPSAPAGC